MRVQTLLMMAGLVTGTCCALQAKDLRIETRIYVVENEDEEKQVGRNLTFFRDNVVYDFIHDPPVATVFQPPTQNSPGRFIVLDQSRQIKTELSTDQLRQLIDTIQRRAAQHEDKLIRFSAAPTFDVTSGESDGQWKFGSDHITYRVKSMACDDSSSASLYRQFTDWYARFNALEEGGMLPFPRLRVNQTLGENHRIPTEVELEIPSYNVHLRSRHRVGRILSKHDRKQIDEALKQMQTFTAVAPSQFLRGDDARLADASDGR